jgi:hypothetical protein
MKLTTYLHVVSSEATIQTLIPIHNLLNEKRPVIFERVEYRQKLCCNDNRRVKKEVIWEERVPVSLCPPQIPHGMIK